MKAIVISVIAAVALVGIYLLAGGAAYAPSELRDPCQPREWREPGNVDELAQQLALSGLDGAACQLDVSREELARALPTEEGRAAFMEENGIDDTELEDAARAGLMRMIDDAEEAGEISSLVALGLRGAARVIPAREAFELLLDARPLIERGFDFSNGLEEFSLDSLLGALGLN